jgi:hypothetical protein
VYGPQLLFLISFFHQLSSKTRLDSLRSHFLFIVTFFFLFFSCSRPVLCCCQVWDSKLGSWHRNFSRSQSHCSIFYVLRSYFPVCD